MAADPATRPGAREASMQTFDPTENVKALTAAEARRQDDLRDVQNSLIAEQIAGVRREIALRAEHAEEIRRLDTDRLEKIRAVDVANAAATAAQLLAAVQTLASTAQATAETLRNQVAATAAAVASQTERVVNPIVERIALLERSAYIGAGKAGVADPQMERLSLLVEKMATTQSAGAGKSEGSQQMWGYVVGAVGLIAAVVAILSRLGG